MTDFDDAFEQNFDQRPQNQEPTPPVEIPADSISSDALTGVIDGFVSREGTDYGATEVSHETKIERVRKQLERGEIKIIFDPDSESVTLMTSREWAKLQAKFQ